MALHAVDWARSLRDEDLPPAVQTQLRRCVLDGLGAAVAGAVTATGRIAAAAMRDLSARGPARVLASGDGLAVPGAVFANVVAANALDIDDGYRPVKGHPGGFVIMPALAACQERGGARFLTGVAAGYELATRAGVATHRYYTHYHASGSWGTLGTAGCLGHIFGLARDPFAWALGLAEYHAALSPIERCLGTPAMTKDGIGWGAYAGAVAACLAERGFTGNPSLFDDPENADLTADLGTRWRLLELYFKPYPCCRWAQQGVDAVLHLRREHGLESGGVHRLVLHTFREATLLQQTPPATTEEAQYHLFWPLAAALAYGRVGPEHVAGDGLHDPRLAALLARMEAVIDPALQARFPAEALAWVEIETRDGARLRSPVLPARGDAHIPLTDAELEAKFREITEPVIGGKGARALIDAVAGLDAPGGPQQLIDVVGTLRLGEP